MKLIGFGIRLLLVLLLIGALLLAALVGYIAYRETHLPAAENFDALIVLGAQVKADGTPSVQLGLRVKAAYAAWQKHPCMIVTCGGQGADEPRPEGDVMRELLIALGVPEQQIISEPASTNTRQNLRNAKVLLAGQELRMVGIVTSDYHVPRALMLAADEGLTATGIPAPTKPEYWLKNHVREALSWIKYIVQKYASGVD